MFSRKPSFYLKKSFIDNLVTMDIVDPEMEKVPAFRQFIAQSGI
jgi:hypothetical protein